MRLSFDDEGSFQEAVESIRFNSSDPNTRQQMGSNNSMPLEDTERNDAADRDDIAPVIQFPSASGKQQKSEYTGDSEECG